MKIIKAESTVGNDQNRMIKSEYYGNSDSDFWPELLIGLYSVNNDHNNRDHNHLYDYLFQLKENPHDEGLKTRCNNRCKNKLDKLIEKAKISSKTKWKPEKMNQGHCGEL